VSKMPRTIQGCARLGLPLGTLRPDGGSGETNGPFVFDAHMHLGGLSRFHTPVHDAAGAVAVMDRIGIRAGCASATAAVVGSDLRAGNDLVIAAVKEFPGRIRGYAVADPNHAEGMVAELERCAGRGLAAVKIHSDHGKPYDADEYRPAYEFANHRSWPLMAHGSIAHADALSRLAGEYRNIRWVFAHASSVAATDAESLRRIARNLDNVFFDTCGFACEYGAVETLVEAVGVERVLFGSDAVVLSAAQQIGKVLFARLSDSDKEAILGLNALKVFGLPKP
jgi:uncharacterized protein